MCVEMFTGICMDMRRHSAAGPGDMCVDVCGDMCVDMCVGAAMAGPEQGRSKRPQPAE